MLWLLSHTARGLGPGRLEQICPQRHCVGLVAKRLLNVLAIETSCDDTSVALVQHETHQQCHAQSKTEWQAESLRVKFHQKVTANNEAYTGIHPLVALESHRRNLAPLIQNALEEHPDCIPERNSCGRCVDLIAVTRGPGMRSNLAVGIDTAKGMATAWRVPLIGVHHMQAHALTPRLVTAMKNNAIFYKNKGHAKDGEDTAMMEMEPRFPFLSVLVSGGHTMLIDSSDLTEHAVVAETQDIAMGDCLDKAARVILPPSLLKPPFGQALENFAFKTDIESLSDHDEYGYTPPLRRQEELERRPSKWGWSLAPPLAESKGGEKSSRRMVYSFAGLLSAVERYMKFKVSPDGTVSQEFRRAEEISLQERQDMAREVQRVAFEHLASRILLFLSDVGKGWKGNTIVVSGGVASNYFLRHVLRGILDVRGYKHVKLSFPPVHLCTDNALMIAWAAIEMYQAGYTSSLDIEPIRKWHMDAKSEGGGILGVEGWIKDDNERKDVTAG
ncbi:hypothetical protein M433DRAFT_61465 [Acidomyces richmondensis BFW]|nr:MAG: hypothetical protein FE78DRAFT_138257 [Acidomyces sp. 'richmondensis']KYG48242.1 hypothetical protein M433DRAFT_61465 [Acidomyces richmondensis BFW]